MYIYVCIYIHGMCRAFVFVKCQVHLPRNFGFFFFVGFVAFIHARNSVQRNPNLIVFTIFRLNWNSKRNSVCCQKIVNTI